MTARNPERFTAAQVKELESRGVRVRPEQMPRSPSAPLQRTNGHGAASSPGTEGPIVQPEGYSERVDQLRCDNRLVKWSAIEDVVRRHVVAYPDPALSGFRVLRGGYRSRTEQRFLREHILPRMAAGELQAWAYEPVVLRLNHRETYEPDFLVITAAGQLELWEVKGGWHRDGVHKARATPSIWHPLTASIWTWKNRRWHREVVA